MSSPRRRARRAAVQALYQWDITGGPPDEIILEFHGERAAHIGDGELFDQLVRGATASVADLDGLLAPLLDRNVAELDPVARSILRLGAFELASRHEVPWRVVISEAVDLAHTFGPEQSHRYVNGVLDRLARTVREHEVAMVSGSDTGGGRRGPPNSDGP